MYNHIICTIDLHNNHSVYLYIGIATSFQTPPLNLSTNSTFGVTLEAVNGAGQRRTITTTTDSSTITYTGYVRVWANFARIENESGIFLELEQSSSSEDFVCLWTSEVIWIEFSAPDMEQNIAR